MLQIPLADVYNEAGETPMNSAVRTADDLVTVEQFYRLIPDGQKADLLDGVIYVASPDSLRANQLTSFVEFLIKGFSLARGLGGEVLVSRFAFTLTPIRAPEPDVAYVRSERRHLLGPTGMNGGPDIAVEIVSRESRTRDYGEKKRIYEEAEVTEYWIIDPLQRRVEFNRIRDGRYELVPLEENRIFRSSVIHGFWLDVNWLLADPLPNAFVCVQQILQ